MITSNAVVAVTPDSHDKPQPSVEPRLSDRTGTSLQPMPDPYRARTTPQPGATAPGSGIR